MKFKRLLILLLAALCVFPTSCSNNSADETESNQVSGESTSDESSVETEEIDENARENAKDNLPDTLNFDGETITILHRGGDEGAALEVYVEENNADVVVNAVYNRNVIVADRLGVNIQSIATTDTIHQGGAITGMIRTSVTADTNDYDIFANHMGQTIPLILEGALLNLSDKQYLDWEQPWWNHSYIDEISINDKFYFAVGELSTTMIRGTYVTFINKSLFGEVFPGTKDIYQVVLDGEWTLDKMKEYCGSAYNDANGNQLPDKGDTFGNLMNAGTDSSKVDAWLGASDVSIVSKDSDGVPQLVIGNERTYDFVDAIKDLFFSDNYTYLSPSDDDLMSEYLAGNGIFMVDRLDATAQLRDMEDDYGIIPMPKLDENQADYTGFTHNGSSVFAIPITNDKIEASAALLEALCAENYRTVTPAYYELALKGRYARDEVFGQMLDMINANVRFDFGNVYASNLSDMNRVFRRLCGDEASNPASTIASTKKVTAKLLSKFVESFGDLEY